MRLANPYQIDLNNILLSNFVLPQKPGSFTGPCSWIYRNDDIYVFFWQVAKLFHYRGRL